MIILCLSLQMCFPTNNKKKYKLIFVVALVKLVFLSSLRLLNLLHRLFLFLVDKTKKLIEPPAVHIKHSWFVFQPFVIVKCQLYRSGEVSIEIGSNRESIHW